MNSVSADSLRQNIILVFITCGLLLFLGLSARELSDDEAVIAFRAKAAAGKSAWTDQSAFTPGGVMNATQAPLQVWAEMLFVRTAGWTKPFMLRVWSVLCGVAALVLVYRIAAYRLPPSEALAAPVLLAGSLVWNDVARSAISAVPVVTFLLLAFVAAIEATAGTPVHASGAADPWRRRAWSCVYAVAVCCSLLLDTVFGCMALVLLLGVRRRGMRELLFGAIAGVLLSLPWFVHMTALHGSPALRAALASSLLLRDAAGVPVGAGVVNLTGLVASQPLVIIAIIGLALSWRRGRSEDESHAGSAQETMLRVWALAGMALCALPVPGHVAVVFVVPVLAILAVTQRTSVFRTASSTRMLTGAFLFLLLLVLVRLVTYAGSIHHPDADLSALSVVSALFLATGAARIIPRHRVSRFNGFMIRQTRMLVPALLVIHCG
ncbi:MAG: ArnT family glycosyltransferase [Candidatus Kapaibacterium sp.]